jgi:hypothetical protein
MASLHKYRLFCQTEGINVYGWGESSLSKCPNDGAHTIDSSSLTIVDSLSKNLVRIQEEHVETGGNYYLDFLKMVCPANTTTEKSFVWEYPITVMAGYTYTSSDYINDSIDVEVGSNTVVGAITSNVVETDTVINVSSTVITNVKRGHYIRLTDGISASVKSLVVSVDTSLSTLTLKDQVGFVFSAASPTYVQLTVMMCRDHEFGEPGKYTIGKNTINGSYIPEGVSLKVFYKNNNNVSKTLRISLDIYY